MKFAGYKRRHQQASQQTGEQNRRSAWQRWAAITAGSAVLIGGLVSGGRQYVNANMVSYYTVYMKNQAVGTIQSEDELKELFEEKRQQYDDKYPEVTMVLNTNGISTEQGRAYKAEVDSEATLDKLGNMLTAYAKGIEVKVDGKVVAVVKDQVTAEAVLNQVKDRFAPKEKARQLPVQPVAAVPTAATSKNPVTTMQSVDIKEPINYEAIKADPNKVMTADEAVKALTTGQEAPIVYTVQEGDTFSSISKQYGIPQSEIQKNNPSVKEKYLQIGDQLKLTVPKPPITVKTVQKASEQLTIAPQVVVRKSDQLKAGKMKVVRPGQNGLKQMNYRITKENDQVVQEEWLGQSVLKPSLPEVVLKGTKISGEGSGDFAWPVSGAVMSSSYGERWGKMHKGVDMVGSSSVKAADEGTVTFAGQQSGYGNVIIINHHNGYETLYGHLKSIGVHTGQVVQKGQQIGVMGSTGRSTGTHLHFEIHKNNQTQNPLTYLR
ncbi:M23 family metallopeptidase [Paenibacillus sp. JX-17]|uniref:M23 family metallopeptidase n=1 Tax=Paenibacillus lacisoli TaxID=3064525 RepID=A0ABT9CDZ4_9BACL|nr:M23 family metallopeptidase [Paenibacillus sp. JX-17]MDO7906192.1 M23 family metallopeptidase [Paenibacillus sp. JX-17]